MQPHIKLTFVDGSQSGKQIVLAKPGTFLVGRAEDCDIRIPNDFEYRTVSRHHCLVVVKPEEIRVRDLGSRNGTFVNGIRIGRMQGLPPDKNSERETWGDYELKSGDQLRAADIAFSVSVADGDASQQPSAAPENSQSVEPGRSVI